MGSVLITILHGSGTFKCLAAFFFATNFFSPSYVFLCVDLDHIIVSLK